MTVVSVIARLMTVNKMEGKTDATLISRGKTKKITATLLDRDLLCCGLITDATLILRGFVLRFNNR